MNETESPNLVKALVSRCPSNNNGGLDYAVFEVDGMFGKRKIVIDNRPKPVRIQRSRKEKQVSPNGLPIIYVGRPTKWGNPFKIWQEVGDMLSLLDSGDFLFYGEGRQVCSHFEAVYLFEKYALTNEFKELVKAELKGKNLSCWCRVTDICHASILLKIANS